MKFFARLISSKKKLMSVRRFRNGKSLLFALENDETFIYKARRRLNGFRQQTIYYREKNHCLCKVLYTGREVNGCWCLIGLLCTARELLPGGFMPSHSKRRKDPQRTMVNIKLINNKMDIETVSTSDGSQMGTLRRLPS